MRGDADGGRWIPWGVRKWQELRDDDRERRVSSAPSGGGTAGATRGADEGAELADGGRTARRPHGAQVAGATGVAVGAALAGLGLVLLRAASSWRGERTGEPSRRCDMSAARYKYSLSLYTVTHP
jgi:hypothetical protein